ncbi:MAG: hypothetical protein ACKV2T_25300 [Kofleriaceae bacterium]
MTQPVERQRCPEKVTGLREVDPLDTSRPRAGEIVGWARLVAWMGAIVTVAICFAAPRLLANQGDDPVLDAAWFRNALGLGALAFLVFIAFPIARTQRSLRVAAALPMIHLLGIGVAWLGWTQLSMQLDGAVNLTPLVQAIPLGAVLATVVAATLVAAMLVARRRRQETTHAMVMISLVALLLLGAWLPIVASQLEGPRYLDSWYVDIELVATPTIIAAVLLPPFLTAVLYTALSLRRARVVVAGRLYLLIGVGILWFVALSLRGQATELAMVTYANYLPWIFSGAVTVVVAILALAASTWRRTRARRSAQHTGIVAAPAGEMVAGYAITSWLRGPEPVCSAFELTTQNGPLPIPASARILAPLPIASTTLRVGEIVPALYGGEEVSANGFEKHANGEPFRDSNAPIPSTRGVDVAPTTPGRTGLEQLALAAWRPSIAYLLVLLAVAGPALITLSNAH